MARVVFNATKDQINFAAALAANAAIPAGMGRLQYDADHEFTAQEMARYWEGDDNLSVDYAQGRCTKLRIWKATPIDTMEIDQHMVDGFKWMCRYETQPTYETWFTKYPTHVALLQAAGITDFNVIGPR